MAVAHADTILDVKASLGAGEDVEDWMWEVPEALNKRLSAISARRRDPKRKDDEDVDWDDESKFTRSEIVPEGWR